ncbi:hypothetical protein LguiA_027966 [Lonicera macranthoides]
MAASDIFQASLGSLISVTMQGELRYEGYLFYVNAEESTIGLKNVKFRGTEGRRMDGPQIEGLDHTFPCMYFQGSNIKMQVLSAPDVNVTANLPEDPAIIRDHSVGSSQSQRPSSPPPTRNVSGEPEPVIGPGQSSSQSGPFFAGKRGVFVSYDVLIKNLLELLAIMKAEISPPSPSPLQDGNGDVDPAEPSGSAQEPRY